MYEAYSSSKGPPKTVILCCCSLRCSTAASHVAPQALYSWRSRYNSSSRAVNLLLHDSRGRCLCMCARGSVCVSGMRAVMIQAHTPNDQREQWIDVRSQQQAGAEAVRSSYHTGCSSLECLCAPFSTCGAPWIPS